MFEDFFSVSYHGFCSKVAPEAIAIFLLVCFINDFVRSDCRSSDDFAGICFREWDVFAS